LTCGPAERRHGSTVTRAVERSGAHRAQRQRCTQSGTRKDDMHQIPKLRHIALGQHWSQGWHTITVIKRRAAHQTTPRQTTPDHTTPHDTTLQHTTPHLLRYLALGIGLLHL
jgi:hypothetical protein